jgi:5-formyltetrahydrofolate cyclo-ligase
MSNSTLRKLYKQKRLELSQYEVNNNSSKISDNFIKHLLPKISNFTSKKIAFYVAIKNEVDPILIIQHCQKLGNIICLPKTNENSLILNFKEYKIGDKLIKNKIYQKLLEPEIYKKNIIPDIIFVPLVAFDNHCNRIGMGGGFYDATINYLRQKNHSPIFIGIGYNWQNCQKITKEQWDKTLDIIVSENCLLQHNQHRSTYFDSS